MTPFSDKISDSGKDETPVNRESMFTYDDDLTAYENPYALSLAGVNSDLEKVSLSPITRRLSSG